MLEKNKFNSLDEALLEIERHFGKGSIMRLGSTKKFTEVEIIPTGSLSLDIALGTGGLPLGRIVEIYGPESSGKTTLTLQVIASAQKLGKCCAFIDAEHSIDPFYAAKLGVDTNKLLFSQPDTGEQALSLCDFLSKSSLVQVIVVDSVAALTPKAEIEGEIGDVYLGLTARMMSQALRRLAITLNQSNTLLIFINQLRIKIGQLFGNPEVTPGGNALKFFSSVRLDIRKTGFVKEGDNLIGNETKVKVVKNKIAPPFKQAEFQIIFGKGINTLGEIINLAINNNIINKSGSWYSYNDLKLGQGINNTLSFFQKHPDLIKEVENKIRNLFFTPG